jgi:hypothetical protein
MQTEKTFGALLALLLVLQFAIGNLPSAQGDSLNVFPWMIGVVLMPFVLWPAMTTIGLRRHGARLTETDARRVGVVVTAYAAVIFGPAVGLLSWVYFGTRPAMTALIVALTVLGTLVMGILASAFCAALIVRRLRAP